MATILTGLFPEQQQASKISGDLKTSGFSDDDFIVYLHDKPLSKEVKTTLWQSFFKDNQKLQEDNLVVSVRLREPSDKDRVQQIFTANGALCTNSYENIKFQDAQSLTFLKRIVALRAKAQIASSPQLRHHAQGQGINSEVSFGK